MRHPLDGVAALVSNQLSHGTTEQAERGRSSRGRVRMSSAVARRGEQVSVLGLLSVNRMFANLWQHRDLLWQFTVREVLVRNKGTSLGVGWSLLMPLITLSVYAFVFGVVFPVKLGGCSAGLFLVLNVCGATHFYGIAVSVVRDP